MGTGRTKDLTDFGIPRRYLARLCDEGLLVKVELRAQPSGSPQSGLIHDTSCSGANRGEVAEPTAANAGIRSQAARSCAPSAV
ncbi:MAG TPA: type IV toxin-antitoxin system AbiEi family antitoxin domain-containing protein [Roseiarcus sp.]|nr:type IV toxin-antitoxin system AbiEi family antitoxin domain-containing protein [Roseiarcus sp.]